MDLREKLKEKILIFDGAMGTYLGRFNLEKDDLDGYEGLNEYLTISRPDIVKQVYEDYLNAGADIIETNTFGANRAVLSEYGLEDKTRELNLASARLAVEAAAEYSKKGIKKFVAGSVGPTNKSIFVTGGISFDEMKNIYFEQVSALLEGGVDLIVFETAHDIINVKAGLAAALAAFEKIKFVETIVSLNMDKNNIMLSGQDARSAYSALEHFPLFALGFNCSTGPEDMASRIGDLRKISKFPLFMMPNAGLPNDKGEYAQTPEKFSSTVKDYAEAGLINIAGGCCGTGPEHIKALAASLKGIKPRPEKLKESLWSVSGVDSLFFDDIEAPVMIGERNNSIGSRKFRNMIAAGKWDEAIEITKNQAKAGAHMLDICLSNPERNEIDDISFFVPKVFRASRLPIMIDSADVSVMEAALKLSPGKCVLNSVNFEFGEEKPEEAVRLAKEYGAKIVFGVIDEDKEKGLPLEAERKLKIAERGYKFFTGLGVKPEDLIFDALVFPAAVGDKYQKAALETIKAVKLMKENFPKSKTILGVSNVSFGLPPKAREVVNSVFLHYAVKSGLDMAIVNIEKLKRYAFLPKEEIKLAADLIFSRTSDAAKKIADYFRDKKAAVKTETNDNAPPEERLYSVILEGAKSRVQKITEELLKEKSPTDIINGPVLRAMKKVGHLFNVGDLIVTEVLQSAEAVKISVDAIKPFLKADAPKKEKILLATVNGDVHDIGKNLVRMIFESNGYTVIDLGIKVPAEKIVEKALSENPDFIGLSGLLVRSTKEMEHTAAKLKEAGINVPLLVGGAALTKKFADSNIASVYGGQVIYSRSAMDGLNQANKAGETGNGERADRHRKTVVRRQPEDLGEEGEGKWPGDKYRPENIPAPKDFERHIFKDYDLKELFANINESMFKARFLKIGRNRSREEKAKRTFNEIKESILKNKIIKAKGIYRIFKINAEGGKILFYDENDRIIEEIKFLRQKYGERLAVPDFVYPASKNKKDFTGLFVVSCGEGIRRFVKNEINRGNYLKAYLTEALSLSLAEAFAEIIHYKIRENFGIAEEYKTPLHLSEHTGKRYSFGYSSCPDLANQKKLFNLLKPSDIRIKLTSSYMMEPEASVSGFVLNNPKARYFRV